MSDIITGDIATDTAWIGRTPHGHGYWMRIRPGTSDWNTVHSCSHGNDEYAIPQGLTGWALDIGAHIGACTIPLLLDNPDLQVIAVEALPENVLLLNENAIRNDVAHRLVIIHGAASDTHDDVRIGYGSVAGDEHRYIGGIGGADSIVLKGITLGHCAALRPDPLEPFVWTKIDCEGSEYYALHSSHVDLLEYITGEHHRGIAGIHALLDDMHDVTMTGGTEDFGHFEARLRA